MDLKEDDIVMCKVQKIEGAAVFLKIEGSEIEGHMILSEVAAGRIRNLRQYVSPGRMVVCKVLRVNSDSIELSLRRVTAREREIALDLYKKERAFRNVLNFVGENSEEVIAKIKKNHNLAEFFEEMQKNGSLLESYMDKGRAAKVLEVFGEKESVEKEVRKKILLRSFGENGVEDIKFILDVEAEISYLGGGRFSIATKASDFKTAQSKLAEVIQIIEKKAREKKAFFELEKEK